MPKTNRRRSQREEMVAIDLGVRTTKAVHLRRIGDDYLLLNYVLVDAPGKDRALSRAVWAEHLRKVVRALSGTTRRVVLSLGTNSGLLSQVDLPGASAADLRKMIKLSPRAYLQQDLPDHLFDCHVGSAAPEEVEVGGLRPRKKSRVLVAAARRSLVEDLVDGARDAGLTVEAITLGQVALANAFQKTNPDASAQPVALIDIGYQTSTISILHEGELALTRVVNLGAERLTALLDQASMGGAPEQLDEEYPLSDALQMSVQKAINGLAREIDASIGFFLSQHDRPVIQLYVSGGSARSHFILQTLEAELGLPCRNWNPTAAFELKLPEGKAEEVDYEAPQLTAAVGALLTWMEPSAININLLAEDQELAEWRRRDPVRRATVMVGVVLVAIGCWAGWLGWQIWDSQRQVERVDRSLALLRQTASGPLRDAQHAGDLERRRAALAQHEAQRFVTAPVLDALQHVVVDGIQFHRLTLERRLQRIDPPRVSARQRRAAGDEPAAKPPPAETREHFVMRIEGKNYGTYLDRNRLTEAIARHRGLRSLLRPDQPIRLIDTKPRQIDPADTSRSFELFTIECVFAERRFLHE
jgi:type IV pilus assembly protein PilM